MLSHSKRVERNDVAKGLKVQYMGYSGVVAADPLPESETVLVRFAEFNSSVQAYIIDLEKREDGF